MHSSGRCSKRDTAPPPTLEEALLDAAEGDEKSAPAEPRPSGAAPEEDDDEVALEAAVGKPAERPPSANGRQVVDETGAERGRRSAAFGVPAAEAVSSALVEGPLAAEAEADDADDPFGARKSKERRSGSSRGRHRWRAAPSKQHACHGAIRWA